MPLIGLSQDTAQLLADLKRNIMEDTHPYFKDEQLVHILELHDNDLNRASFHAMVVKAEVDQITLPSGLSMPNSRQYWLSLAKTFRTQAGGNQKRGDSPCR